MLIRAFQNQTDPLLYFVRGILGGEYDGSMFGALFSAWLVKIDKERRGVGMQGFRYLPPLKDLGYVIHMTSPSAYKILREFIPLEHPRTIRWVQLNVHRAWRV